LWFEELKKEKDVGRLAVLVKLTKGGKENELGRYTKEKTV
jgi:hypothetical protein